MLTEVGLSHLVGVATGGTSGNGLGEISAFSLSSCLGNKPTVLVWANLNLQPAGTL